jgi:oligosaccharide reducing-end xylanase
MLASIAVLSASLAHPQSIPAGYPPVVHLTAEQDHQRIMDLLGMTTIRRGRDGSPDSPYAANYDESKANPYPNLPDPLILNNGKKVSSAKVWWSTRRPQIGEFFNREIYGRVPKSTPNVTWELKGTEDGMNGNVPIITKTLVGRVDNSAYPLITVNIQLELTTPANATGPVPVIMEFGFIGTFPPRPPGTAATGQPARPIPPASLAAAGPTWQQQVLAKGWGYAEINTASIQADNGAGLTEGIIGLCNHGQPRKLDDWGALRAWAWGASRALDYFETDKAVNAREVGIEGHSRYGKAAIVAMAYDQRFAIVYCSSSGEGGAKLNRRNWGEVVENVAGTGEYHWMAGNFLKYAGPLQWNNLPVDSHELIAMCAPRPVFISGGATQGDGWVDAKGMFMAAAAASPVYRLLGKRGLGTDDFPPMETPVIEGDLAFRQHSGGHTPAPNWPTFITFASRYLSAPSSATGSASAARDGVADDGSGAYRTGRYRNLFMEQGHNQAQIDTKIDAAFQQLFHGDKDSQTVYYEAGSNANGALAYVTDVANHDARTEGMSYGMMIAVQMNKKQEFDALWNWANTYMLLTDPANPSHGYFAWSMNIDGTPRSDSPAPDGEEYFVMSLYFAANRWGSGQGIYDYKAQADRILSLMRHHPVETGTGPFRLHPDSAPFVPARQNPPANQASAVVPQSRSVGAMVNQQYSMICFVPNSGGNTFTDPSYHLPAFYELWARWGPADDRSFWARAATASRAFFGEVSNPDTGLAPDRANFDGSQMTGRDGQPVPFSYDSWRTASNWSVDYSWWHKDAQEPVLSDRIQRFLFGQGVGSFDDRYTLGGKPLSQRHSIGMVATTATASLAATKGPRAKAFLDELWSVPVPAGPQRYYDGMLYMMSLLHCSGQFRIWGPK